MKRLFFALSLVASVCLSCTQELDAPDGQEMQTVTFDASAPSDVSIDPLGSKAVLSPMTGGYSVYWTSDDAISVNGVTSGSVYVDPADSKKATFVIDNLASASAYCSVYPASAASSFSGSSAAVTLPQTQSYRKASFDPAAAVMLGYSEDGRSLNFSHAMSYLFILAENVDGYDGDNIRYVTVASLGTEALSGRFNASFASACTLEAASSGAYTEVTVDCGASGVSKGTPVIVAVPAGTYSKGVSITITDVNGDVKTLTADRSLTLNAGYVYTASLRIAAPGIYNVAGYNAFAKAVNAGDYSAWKGSDGEVNLYADITSVENYVYITSFDGVLDGNGHKVSCDEKNKPLFNTIAAGATVKNLTTGGTYKGFDNQGEQAFASFARVNLGTIQNCVNETSGELSASSATAFGGFVGQNGGVIRNCVNNGDILITLKTNTFTCYGGGFAALGHTVTGGSTSSSSVAGKFINCVNNGKIIVTVTENAALQKTGFGGICGVVMLDGVLFDGCVNSETAKVHRIDNGAANNACASSVGGILGRSAAVFVNNNNFVDMDSTVGGYNTVFTDCSNSGEIINSVRNGRDFGDSEKGNTKCGTGGIVGALVGKGSSIPSLVRCSNHGSVMAGYNAVNNSHIIGGLAGMARLATFTDCSSTGSISNYSTFITGPVGGFVGFALDDVTITGGTAKPQISIIKQGVSRWSYGLVVGTTASPDLNVSNVLLGGSISVDAAAVSITSANCTDYVKGSGHFQSIVPTISGCTWAGTASRSLTFSSFRDLNAGGSTLNSHKDEYGRSHLALMYSDMQYIDASGTGPRYPRISKRKDNGYMLTWQNGDGGSNNGADTYYALSQDLDSWTYKGELFKRSGSRYYTNANVKLLGDGRLMAVSSFWDKSSYSKSGVDVNDAFPTDAEGIAANASQGISVKFSSDNGVTWTAPQVVYNGPNWECHIMEPSSGHIQIYFSESRPRVSDSHSGTSMIESKDNGSTWTPAAGSKPYRVMRRFWTDPSNKGGVQTKYTCQMPVGIMLNGSSQMAFALECVNGSIGSLGHTVSVVKSGTDGGWENLGPDEETPQAYRNDDIAEGIGPCLVQFTSGETVLSYASESISGTIFHKIGSSSADSFGEERILMQDMSSAVWSSLAVDSDHVLLAVDRDGRSGAENATVALGMFALNHSITATQRTVTADASSSEWADVDEALYIGSLSQANAVIRCSDDASNLYLLVEVQDNSLYSSDYVELILTPGEFSSSSRRIVLNAAGIRSVEKYEGGWTSAGTALQNAVAYEGTLDAASGSKGYVAEIVIPKSSLGIAGGRLLFNASLLESNLGVHDSIADPDSVGEWIYIKGI